jgi:fatty-acyl-CoA synthase
MRFEERIKIAADPEPVWPLVSDPVTIARALGGALLVEPESPDVPPGPRVRYRVLLHVAAAQVGGNVEIVDFEPPREFSWSSVSGLEHRLRLRLRPDPPHGTMLTLRFAYNSPGPLGLVADVAALPQIRGMMKGALEAIKREAEGGGAPAPGGPDPLRWLANELGNVRVLAEAGLVAPMRPDKLVRAGLALRAYGPTLAAGAAAGAARYEDDAMLVDERGEVSWNELERTTDAIAAGLAAAGVREGDAVGLMARNHRGFVQAAVAAAKLGADVLLLNTAFAAPQITDVCRRERPAALIGDEEFSELLSPAARGRKRILSWSDAGRSRLETLDDLAERHAGAHISPPDRHSRITILTSGTTGTPKGASRGVGDAGLAAPASFLSRVPLRARMRTMLAAPLFHAWGLSMFGMGFSLGATFVLHRRFDPEATLGAIEEHRCEALIVVPVMLQRILELPESVRSGYDTSSLRVVAASGSALPGDLANRWMDAFGDNLYNIYGSTEVANATIATPADMRGAPGTAGKPPRGTVVKLLDEHGAEVPQGDTGRIFVGNSMLFEGYTGGGDKDRIGALMSSGDVGRFDEAGRLFVEGRDDDMIVSGGENVFPKEVEDLLSRHPAVAEAACIGVPDEQFGQRLHAFVVRRAGMEVDEDELKAYVRENLARYKVPREITFIDELPRNATGKILKRELAAQV